MQARRLCRSEIPTVRLGSVFWCTCRRNACFFFPSRRRHTRYWRDTCALPISSQVRDQTTLYRQKKQQGLELPYDVEAIRSPTERRGEPLPARGNLTRELHEPRCDREF